MQMQIHTNALPICIMRTLGIKMLFSVPGRASNHSNPEDFPVSNEGFTVSGSRFTVYGLLLRASSLRTSLSMV